MRDIKAKLWNERNAGDGEPYKKFVLDPILLNLMGEAKGKIILDQGCGNGYLSKKIVRLEPKELVLLDLYQGNLECAKNALGDCQFASYIQTDLNESIPLGNERVDAIISNMVLVEVRQYDNAIKETHRILKKNGVFVLSVVHPAFTLKMYLKSNWLGSGNKIKPPRHYLDERPSKFIFGEDSHKNACFDAPHYNRSIETYFDCLTQCGFVIERIIEPRVNKELLHVAPRFKKDLDCPIALIFKARKL